METDLSKFFTIFSENSPTLIMVTDPSGNIQYVNKYFTEITGYSLEEVLGKNPRMFKSGIHGKDFYEDLWKHLKSGAPYSITFCNRKKDHSLFWVSANIIPVLNDDGDITSYISIQVDITEKRQKDLEFELFLNSMEEYAIIFDENKVCIKAFPDKSFFGKPISDLVGKNIVEIFTDRQLVELNDIFDKIDRGELGPHNWYFSAPEKGTIRTAECSVRRFNSHKYVIWGKDVTDKLRLRVLEELKANIDMIIESNINIQNLLGEADSVKGFNRQT